jgi:Na+-transporting methylmalonyl-CoA/oxaloacetate decarboxylase gamma subunit
LDSVSPSAAWVVGMGVLLTFLNFFLFFAHGISQIDLFFVEGWAVGC